MGDSMNGSMGDSIRGRGRGKNRNKNFAGALQEGNQLHREYPGFFSRLRERPKNGNPDETATVMPGSAHAWGPPPERRGWWGWINWGKPQEGELSTRRAEKRARLKPEIGIFDDDELPSDSEVWLSRGRRSPPTFGVFSPDDYNTGDLSPREGLGNSLNEYPLRRGRGFRTRRRGGAKRKTLKKKRRVRSSTKKGRGRR
jgi:hypothetical protein